MRNVKPDILIGVSDRPGCLRKIIREMHKHCPRPIVMPLSTRRHASTTPQGHYRLDYNALVATGSPFNPVVWKDKIYPIAQQQRLYFPGIGLVLLLPARHVSPMRCRCRQVKRLLSIRRWSEQRRSGTTELKDIQKVSAQLPLRLANAARRGGENVCRSSATTIDDNFCAEYRDYRRTSI
ncbi:MAG: malic enzyme-like NAD(P)-binding protein [Escherichia sp.]